jgi:hypothetical protein
VVAEDWELMAHARDDRVDAKVFPPLLAGKKHLLRLWNIELARAEEPVCVHVISQIRRAEEVRAEERYTQRSEI